MRKALIIALTALIGLTPFVANAETSMGPTQAVDVDLVASTQYNEMIEWAAPQLDGYYKTLFALQGQEYRTPQVTIVGEGEKAYTGCGVAASPGMAFYCPADEQIVLSQDIVDTWTETDEVLPMFVLAHEWAHHVQHLSGTSPRPLPNDGDWNQVYVIENELRADCMAGAWVSNIEARGYLDASDVPAILMLAESAGDTGIFGRGRSHGTEAERLRATFLGYDQGIFGCMAITPLSRDDSSSINPPASNDLSGIPTRR